MWAEGLYGCLFPTVSTMIIFVVSVNVIRFLIGEFNIHIKDSKKHNWQVIKRTSRVNYTLYSF
jgi:hypothetical protein